MFKGYVSVSSLGNRKVLSRLCRLEEIQEYTFNKKGDRYIAEGDIPKLLGAYQSYQAIKEKSRAFHVFCKKLGINSAYGREVCRYFNAPLQRIGNREYICKEDAEKIEKFLESHKQFCDLYRELRTHPMTLHEICAKAGIPVKRIGKKMYLTNEDAEKIMTAFGPGYVRGHRDFVQNVLSKIPAGNGQVGYAKEYISRQRKKSGLDKTLNGNCSKVPVKIKPAQKLSGESLMRLAHIAELECKRRDITAKKYEPEELPKKKRNGEYGCTDAKYAYMREIDLTSRISADEEVCLSKKIMHNAPDAKEAKQKLVQANLRLVVKVAKRYARSDIPFLDLLQDGNKGLIAAAERFDYRFGYKFSTYAIWWIRQSITRAIADSSRTVRVPVRVNEHMNALRKAEKAFSDSENKLPTDKELADALGWDEEKIKQIMYVRMQEKMISLASDVKSMNEPRPLEAIIPDKKAEENLEKMLEKEQVLDAVESLSEGEFGSEREADVIKRRFGLGEYCGNQQTLSEIARDYGVTRERVRQIEAKALRRLRHPNRSKKIRDFY